MHKRLTKKEKAFCVGFVNSGDIRFAVKYSGVDDACELLCRKEICDYITRLSKNFNKSVSHAVSAGLKRLALSDNTDAVSLVFDDHPSPEKLKGMNLFLISEIKKKGNSVEIKFFDRFKALSELMNAESGDDGGSFYEALVQGARAVGDDED